MIREKENKYHQGKFKPQNPDKYAGDPDNIVYRSSWELKLFKVLDTNPNVLEWCSEEVIVPYISPLDNRPHRYFPDVIVKIRNKQGIHETLMVEVKPFYQVKEPERGNKRKKTFLKEVVTWGINQAKWEAAKKYCADKGWRFCLMTEKELGI